MTDVFSIGGFLFILAVFVRISFLLREMWKESYNRDAQRQLTLQLLEQRLESTKIPVVSADHQHEAWNGHRKFVVKKIVQEAKDIASFYLYPHDKKPLPSFRPGQHLIFKLQIPDRPKPLIRCYSLSNGSTQSEWYRVSIKRIPAPPSNPDAPPGLASTYFHTQLKEGDILDVKAPSGKFFLDVEKKSPVVFLAGGIGLTPLLSMIETLVAKKSEREFWLFYGMQGHQDQVMKEPLEELVHQFPNMRLHVFYSQSTPSESQASQNVHQGIISVTMLKQLLPSNNYEFYVCGPPPMMNTLVPQLKEWGVPDSKVFSEAFGPASVKKAPPLPKAQTDGLAVEVVFAKSGKTLSWDNSVESLLEFAEKEGISMDSGCRSGSCGTCLTAIKSGEVEYRTTPGEKPEAGSCLPCISIPKGNIVLDA